MSLTKNKNILVVAAHPDDEALGCGGAIAKHSASGDDVHILILAEGVTARVDKNDAVACAEDIKELRFAACDAAKILGANSPRFGGLPDNRMDGISLLDVIKLIETVAAEVKPEIVYTHHEGDLNNDHRIVHQAAITAFRPLPGTTVRAVYAFEAVSSTEWAVGEAFRPTSFMDIKDHLEAKMRALACYDMEMRAFPHPRSYEGVKALAAYRGTNIGVPAAEAFKTVWEIV